MVVLPREGSAQSAPMVALGCDLGYALKLRATAAHASRPWVDRAPGGTDGRIGGVSSPGLW